MTLVRTELVESPYNSQFKKVRQDVYSEWLPLDAVPDPENACALSAKAMIVQDKVRINERAELVDFIVAKPKMNIKASQSQVANAAIAAAKDKWVKVYSKTGELMMETKVSEPILAISSGPDPDRTMLVVITETSLIQMPLKPEYVLGDLKYNLDEAKMNSTELPRGNYKNLLH